MKFCILCLGSHGDIRPYLALGVELKAQGHDVYIASHQKAESFCRRHHLDFVLVDGDITEIIHKKEGQGVIESLGSKKLSNVFEIVKVFRGVLDKQLNMSWEAVRDADVLIYSPTAFAGPHIAESLKIPSFRMMLQPEIRTGEHASFLFPNQKFLGSLGHFLGHLLSEQLFWQPIRGQINKWRKEQLNLKKMHFFGPMGDSFARQIPTIVAFSPILIERPSDWDPHIHMTGFCRLFEGKNWRPPNDLKNFIEDRPLPIYIGFGSLTEMCPKSVVRQIIEVLKRKGLRAIVSDKLPGLRELELPSFIFPSSYVPHDWLFPRVRVVIHHGGIGTTAAGLYAGKPTLIIPFAIDQFFWGEKIFDLGVGPEPLSIKNFNESLFASRLDELLDYSSYQEKASQLMDQLLEEGSGIKKAIEIIYNTLN